MPELTHTLRTYIHYTLRIYKHVHNKHIPIFKELWTSSPVFIVVEEGTSIALSTQSGRPSTRFYFIVGQHVAVIWRNKQTHCTGLNWILKQLHELFKETNKHKLHIFMSSTIIIHIGYM